MYWVDCKRGKLPDYTKQGRPDLPCITAAELREASHSRGHSPDSSMQITSSMNQLSIFDQMHSSSPAQDDVPVEEPSVDFFLKVPSTRRRPSQSDRSRKNLILACEQRSPMLTAKSNSSRFLWRKDGRCSPGRGEAFIDRVLRQEGKDVLLLRRTISRRGKF